ncbi:MAG: DEAD/DEAH box helicase, partial [Muribaculaceae bacterium]|nr:DEAD/DEAH box helicase [Muribaculaceae bacterium]
MDSPVDILRRYWGYDSFRPCQREIVDDILAGHDVTGLLPTGGGKSITFQVPALMLPGVTLVGQPLIELMNGPGDPRRG